MPCVAISLRLSVLQENRNMNISEISTGPTGENIKNTTCYSKKDLLDPTPD